MKSSLTLTPSPSPSPSPSPCPNPNQVHALLAGTDEAAARLSPGMQPAVLTPTLGYLRDRISVPRDMCYPAARQLRAHLNWLIDTTARAEA